MIDFNNWSAQEYLRDLCRRNKLAQKNNFCFCLSSGSGWDGLEEVVSKMRTETSFFVVDETAETETRKFGGGWFETTVFSIFLLTRCKKMDEESRLEAIKLCRKLKKQLMAKFIVDAEELKSAMIYLDTDFSSRELGQSMLNGITGLYMSFSFYRPEDLVLNEDDFDPE